MSEECLICGAPLTYLDRDEPMECTVCHKKEDSKTRCVNGHYVCSVCHTQGMDAVTGLCLGETSKDPIAILERMMAQPFCHMHGPEHHVMVGAALLTAYKNAGGELDLPAAGDVEAFDGPEAIRRADALLKDYDAVLARLRKKSAQLTQAAGENERLLLELLESSKR